MYKPGIWVMPVSGGAPARIADGNNGVPSPDGKRIALTSADESILWVAGANGKGLDRFAAAVPEARSPR